MNLAENIKAQREKIGFTQELLAEKLDVSRQAVSKWESGESAPSAKNIIAMSKLFGIDEKTLTYSQSNSQCNLHSMGNTLSFLCLLLALFPLCVALIAHNYLPSEIPAHYNALGEVDRWGSSLELAALGAVFTCLSTGFYFLIKRIVSRSQLKKIEEIIIWSIALLMPISFTVIQIVFSINAALLSVSKTDFLLFQSMFSYVIVFTLLISPILPRLKQNSLFGIKTSATLNDNKIWIKTHKIGSVTIAIGSIISGVLIVLLPSSIFYLSLFPYVVGIVVPIAYSLRMQE